MITEDPVADNTDVYAFVSPDDPDMVTLISNWIPLEVPQGGPNFYKFGEDVGYRINIDNNHDAKDDIYYEFKFENEIVNPNTFLYNTGPIDSLDDEDFNQRQSYTVTRVEGGESTEMGSGLATPPVNVGPRSTPNYEALAEEAVHELDGGVKVFAGQRDDAFFVDLGSIFDLLGLRPLNEAHAIPLPTADGIDGVAGFNVHTIAMQVPKEDLVGDDDIIGVYSTTYRNKTRVFEQGGADKRHEGPMVQVSRLGNPLVNEVVVPLKLKDAFNASRPSGDTAFLPLVQDPEPARLIELLYGLDVPKPPREDLVSIFLTGIEGVNKPEGGTPSEMIRLNTSIAPTPFDEQDRLGLLAGQNDGFPNGRRLVDDVVDIELRALAGGTPFTPDFNKEPNNALTDGVDGNDVAFMEKFPYLGTPHPGYGSMMQAAAGGVETGAGGTAARRTAARAPVADPVPASPTSQLPVVLLGVAISAAAVVSGLARRRRSHGA